MIDKNTQVVVSAGHNYAPNKRGIVLEVIRGEYTIYRILLTDNTILYAERTDIDELR